MIQFQTKLSLPSAQLIAPCLRLLAERMAEDMREMAFAGENVNVETLKMRGYSEPVIKRLSPKAVAIARRRSVRQVGEV